MMMCNCITCSLLHSFVAHTYALTHGLSIHLKLINYRQTLSVATNGMLNPLLPMQAMVSRLKLLKTITNLPSSTLTVVTTNKEET